MGVMTLQNMVRFQKEKNPNLNRIPQWKSLFMHWRFISEIHWTGLLIYCPKIICNATSVILLNYWCYNIIPFYCFKEGYKWIQIPKRLRSTSLDERLFICRASSQFLENWASDTVIPVITRWTQQPHKMSFLDIVQCMIWQAKGQENWLVDDCRKTHTNCLKKKNGKPHATEVFQRTLLKETS